MFYITSMLYKDIRIINIQIYGLDTETRTEKDTETL